MRTTSENPSGGESENEKRRAGALGRVRLAIRDAEYHEKQALTSRSRAATLIRTWELCAIPKGGGFCCFDPENCQGRQP